MPLLARLISPPSPGSGRGAMADQPLAGLSLSEPAPALDSLAPGDDGRLKSDIIDEIFGVPELSEPDPELDPDPEPSSRASLRTSLEEEEEQSPPAENLDSVALHLEHALSEVFSEVEGAGSGGSTTGGGEGADASAGGDINGQAVGNGQLESADQPARGEAAPPAATATADDDDDDIVVLDEVAPTKRRGALRGPASKRKDFAQLGPPSSRMPPVELGGYGARIGWCDCMC